MYVINDWFEWAVASSTADPSSRRSLKVETPITTPTGNHRINIEAESLQIHQFFGPESIRVT